MSRRKYTTEILQEAVVNSLSFAGVVRYLNLKQVGGTQTHIARMIRKDGIDTSHFTGQGHTKGRHSFNRKTADQILVVLSEDSPRPRREQLMRAMIEKGVEYVCKECGQPPMWRGKKLTLHVDHKDGDWLNNLLSNLRFMCPNCHDQCETTNMPYKHRK